VSFPFPLRLELLPQGLAVCRLDPDAPLPAWVLHEGAALYSITRTPQELSIVCDEDDVPPSVARVEAGWRAFRLEGPIPFEVAGVLASLVGPLAEAKVPVFALSTFDTDYVLVKERDLERAAEVLARTARVVRR
jgi:hypothetical protein